MWYCNNWGLIYTQKYANICTYTQCALIRKNMISQKYHIAKIWYAQLKLSSSALVMSFLPVITLFDGPLAVGRGGYRVLLSNLWKILVTGAPLGKAGRKSKIFERNSQVSHHPVRCRRGRYSDRLSGDWRNGLPCEVTKRTTVNRDVKTSPRRDVAARAAETSKQIRRTRRSWSI